MLTVLLIQGGVYAKIIQDVLEASQVDFEEGGVDQSTLDKLRKVGSHLFSSNEAYMAL